MSVVAFDTLRFVEKLRKNGFPEQQAKGMAEALIEAQRVWLADVATKTDTTALKGDISALRSDLRHDLASLDVKLHGQMTLVRWMLGLLLAGVLSLVLEAFF